MTTAQGDAPFQACPCGLTFTRAQWEALELIGYTPATEDHEGPLLELRNCPCTSTIARPIASLRDLVRNINATLREGRKQREELREGLSHVRNELLELQARLLEELRLQVES